MRPLPYNPVTDEILEALRGIVGEEHLVLRADLAEEYSHDEMAPVRGWPEVAVFPCSTEEIARIVTLAHENRIPVTTRGAGTGLMGGATAVEGGILLVTARMDRVLEVDEANMVARIEPGVVLLTFQEEMEKRGFFYAPDPGEKSATIGGNVMTNAGGMRAVKHGVTRDHVRGLKVVTADGSVIDLGGKVAKNASGYNLMHLMIGSEGTLGIVTEITVRLLPLPAELTSLLVPFQSLEDAVGVVPTLGKEGIIPQALEFFRRDVLEASTDYLGRAFPHGGAPVYLLLRMEASSPAEMERLIDRTGRLCLEAGAEDVLIADTAERQRALWDARGAFLEALGWSEQDECDIVVPRDRIAEIVLYSDRIAEDIGLRLSSFGHAGDGNIHINILRENLERGEWESRRDRVMELIYQKCAELGGKVSGEHGIGHSKRAFLAQYSHPVELEMMRRIKAAFDPGGILNPGKIL